MVNLPARGGGRRCKWGAVAGLRGRAGVMRSDALTWARSLGICSFDPDPQPRPPCPRTAGVLSDSTNLIIPGTLYKWRVSQAVQWYSRLPSKRCRFNPWVRKIPWGRTGQPTPVLLPGESHRQRSLVGYSPSVQFSSVAQLCPALCDPVDCSTPVFPVHLQQYSP